jgi:hypothetical protein
MPCIFNQRPSTWRGVMMLALSGLSAIVGPAAAARQFKPQRNGSETRDTRERGRPAGTRRDWARPAVRLTFF